MFFEIRAGIGLPIQCPWDIVRLSWHSVVMKDRPPKTHHGCQVGNALLDTLSADRIIDKHYFRFI